MDSIIIGVVAVLITGIASLGVALVQRSASRTGPDTIRSQGERIDSLYRRVDSLESKVDEMEKQATLDRELRHRLKATVAYLLHLARQAITYLAANDMSAELPEPLRSHVTGLLTLETVEAADAFGVWDRRSHDEGPEAGHQDQRGQM